MTSYLEWLQDLPVSMWIAGSESLLSFPLILFLHSIGMDSPQEPHSSSACAWSASPSAAVRRSRLLQDLLAGFFLNLRHGQPPVCGARDDHRFIDVLHQLCALAAGMVLSRADPDVRGRDTSRRRRPEPGEGDGRAVAPRLDRCHYHGPSHRVRRLRMHS